MSVPLAEPHPVHVAAVIPAYNVATHIGAVLEQIPAEVRTVIVVDDCSTDGTSEVVQRFAKSDPRIVLSRHAQNCGVGGTMKTGFRAALDCGAEIIVKIDGDDQMPLSLLGALIAPLLSGEADYTKGNRFRGFRAIGGMPVLRHAGNVVLSFLAKIATGYWHCFDPTNGFVAIRADVLSRLTLDDLDPTYFFETSMLSELYLAGAVVKEIPMPARYAGEPSSLSIPRVLREFPQRLVRAFVKRTRVSRSGSNIVAMPRVPINGGPLGPESLVPVTVLRRIPNPSLDERFRMRAERLVAEPEATLVQKTSMVRPMLDRGDVDAL